MNRLKADLSYQTKREYEDMIKRLENEMQLNHRQYSSREEKTILNGITSLKHGMTLLEKYEEKKRVYDTKNELLSVRKAEQEV